MGPLSSASAIIVGTRDDCIAEDLVVLLGSDPRREQEAEVVAPDRASFAGYISRDDGAWELCRKVRDVAAGRRFSPPHIAASIMRGLFRAGSVDHAGLDLSLLTPHEDSAAKLAARASPTRRSRDSST